MLGSGAYIEIFQNKNYICSQKEFLKSIFKVKQKSRWTTFFFLWKAYQFE
jgi:hypothetical protein